MNAQGAFLRDTCVGFAQPVRIRDLHDGSLDIGKGPVISQEIWRPWFFVVKDIFIHFTTTAKSGSLPMRHAVVATAPIAGTILIPMNRNH